MKERLTFPTLRSAIWLWLAFTATGTLAQDGRAIDPPDPRESAKSQALAQMLDIARGHRAKGEFDLAIHELRRAMAHELTMKRTPRIAECDLAMLLSSQGKDDMAIEMFQQTFKWNADRHELVQLAGGARESMEYAIVLARSGKKDEAVAAYYFGLSEYNSSSRDIEPVPFVTVFDSEPEGVQWEYSQDRLEAAALILIAFQAKPFDDIEKIMARVRKLAPDWYLPDALWAAANWTLPVEVSAGLERARLLARPGLEAEFVRQLGVDIADHIAKNKADDTPHADDFRPMKEGGERRSRMKCLSSSDEVLRRLASDGQGSATGHSCRRAWAGF